MVGKILEAIVAGAISDASRLAIAIGNDAAGFVDDFAPSLTRFFDESCSAGRSVVEDDFVATADGAAQADANFIEVNLKDAAESAMQSVAE